ncbi:BrnA antitoxin family protein [Frigidibacter sp. RF13]|uniref:BrnA antitoxin family protein n=1 Tax=Frigidibacter sp. RF13 TaxID=2997340 RepID=UPI00226E1A9E|nr:BrnA antitoxin family protein [Frigidibacter sp. RF13]MCY1126578.1 BrnA antitoxin family protein [Frigidibacter sp. RF13]
MPALTKAERDRAIAYHDLACTMRDLEADLRWGLNGSLRIPRDWQEMLREPALPRKVKLTLRLDEDVVAFFRAMGGFHLTRMNRVLRSFMLTRLAGVATGPEMVGYRPTAEEEERSLRREVLALVEREHEARAAAEHQASDAEKRRARIAYLKGVKAAKEGKPG